MLPTPRVLSYEDLRELAEEFHAEYWPDHAIPVDIEEIVDLGFGIDIVTVPLAGQGVFARWTQDPSEFEQVKVDPESGTVVWPGGLDVAPDRIYQEIAGSRGRETSGTST